MKPNCEKNFACYDQGMNEDIKSMGRKIGYVRVSDKDQSENLQIDALKAAGCTVIYGDHGVSGAITNAAGWTTCSTPLKRATRWSSGS